MTELEVPVAPQDTQFCADRRRADGSRTFWAVTRADGSFLLRSWNEVSGAWTEGSTSREGASWADAIAAEPDLTTVRSDEMTAYTSAEPDGLLDRLVLAGDEEPDLSIWSIAGDEIQFDTESDYTDGHILRLATMNGKQVSFAKSEPSPVAFLGGSELDGGAVIGAFHWDNGWGSGNSELMQLRPGAAVATSWSESDGIVIRGFRYATGEAGLADVRTAWEDFFAYFHIPQALEAVNDAAIAEEYGIEASLDYYSPTDASDSPAL